MLDKINPVLNLHSIITSMDDSQVGLHLLRSCLGCCKINHLLRTVPQNLILPQLLLFDQNLRSTLGLILHCSISDQVWGERLGPRLGH